MTYRLQRRQVVAGELATVFAFFKDPRNLEAITPPWLHFEIRDDTDAQVREGTRIRYRLRWQVFPLHWESRIAEFEDNRSFADEMLRGPYRRWYHRHLFRAVAGGVEIRDVVEYELPFGPVGRLAHALMVRRQLDAIFAYRRDQIAAIFGDAPAPTSGAHLILFAHGSGDPRWRIPHDALVERLAHDIEADTVRLAFLERMEPSLEDAVAAARAEGAERIVVLPLFLAAGTHLRQDLPSRIAGLRRTHPEVDIRVLPPVGEDPRFGELVQAIASDALSMMTPAVER